MGVLFVDDFDDLSHWSPGGFGIAPAGWAYQVGTGSASGAAMHTQEAGCAYVEARVYGDQTGGDNWFTLKLDSGGGAGYDANGAGILLRSTTGQFAAIIGGTQVWADPAFTGNLPVPPQSPATAALVGVHRVSAGVYDLYLNRKRMAQFTGVPLGGGSVLMCAYNNIGAHVDYVATADRPLSVYDDIRGSSVMVLG